MKKIQKHFSLMIILMLAFTLLIHSSCYFYDWDEDESSSDGDDDDDTEEVDVNDDESDDDIWNPDDDDSCDGCLIEGDCYADGEKNLENDCLLCKTSESIDSWTSNDGASCDDGLWCNGQDTCSQDECTQHEGDPCADDGLWCSGAESCDESEDQCVSQYGLFNPRCPDDEIFCNGDESCDEQADECAHSGDPCPQDDLYCNGEEYCDEIGETCGHQSVPNCPDDGLYCTGDEICDEDSDDCANTGDPCGEETVCREEVDSCLDPCEGYQIDNGDPDEDNDLDGITENQGDCNDANNQINPLADETFDGQDNNCDGVIDEGFDEDCDGYQSEGTGGDDCQDNNADINPGAPDNDTDRVDENCDGKFGDASSGDIDSDLFAASGTEGAVVDCDDTQAYTFPGAAPDDDAQACMRDFDGDEYGDDAATGDVVPGSDCDDTQDFTFPGAAPQDDNDACMRDYDNDDYGAKDVSSVIVAGSDCNDADLYINIDATELPDDEIDNNCDNAYFVRANDNGVFVAPAPLGDDVNPGTMELPKETITAAITLAEYVGKSVFVSAGDYDESVDTPLSLYGGYESVTWTRDIQANATVINGVDPDSNAVKISGSSPVVIEGFNINGGDGGNSYGVHTAFGQAVIANNTIHGGTGDTSYGIYVNLGGAIVINCDISGGSLGSKSIGVFVLTLANATILRSFIDAGNADETIGISSWGNSDILESSIKGGESTDSIGVYVPGSAVIINSVVDGDSGASSSDAVRVQGTVRIVHSIIKGGQGSVCNGVALYENGIIPGQGKARVVNSIVDGGQGINSRGIYLENAQPQAILIHSDIWGASQDYIVYVAGGVSLTDINIVNQCFWGGCGQAINNINQDPQFVDDESSDFHLMGTSDCIDAGVDPNPWYNGPYDDLDVDGDRRPFGASWDIGLDEIVIE